MPHRGYIAQGVQGMSAHMSIYHNRNMYSNPDRPDHGSGFVALDGQLPESGRHHVTPFQEGPRRGHPEGSHVVAQVANDIDPQGQFQDHSSGEVRAQHEHLLKGKIIKNGIGARAGLSPHSANGCTGSKVGPLVPVLGATTERAWELGQKICPRWSRHCIQTSPRTRLPPEACDP